MNGHLRLEFYNTMHDFCMRKSVQYGKCTFEKLNGIFVGTDALHFFVNNHIVFLIVFPSETRAFIFNFLFNGKLYKDII